MKNNNLLFYLVLFFSIPIHAQSKDFLWQTNSQGNNIHIFDLENFQLEKILEVGPQPHGIAAPNDASVIYVSIENNGEEQGELLWIDPHTYAINHRLKVGPEPHAIAATPDGRWIYVPCRDEHYWVIDGITKQLVKKIHTGGRPHNTQASSDGRYMYLSPMGKPKGVTVVDVQANHKVVGFIPYQASVRPSALSPDGHWLLQHVDGLNGFQAALTENREVITTVEHSGKLGWFRLAKSWGYITFGGFKRCHGLGITPDQQEVWSVCADNLATHAFDSNAFKEKHILKLPSKGYWLTFSHDSRYGFIALSNKNEVAVYDVFNKTLLHRLTTGNSPKRNLVVTTNRAIQN